MWVEFVVDSRFVLTIVLRPPPPPKKKEKKPTSPNSNSIKIEDMRENLLRLMRLPL